MMSLSKKQKAKLAEIEREAVRKIMREMYERIIAKGPLDTRPPELARARAVVEFAANERAADMFMGGFACCRRDGLYVVGSVDGETVYILGRGQSYEEAFADALDAKAIHSGAM